jgi:hypothetical protein
LGTAHQYLYPDYQQAAGAQESNHEAVKRSGECEQIRRNIMQETSIDLAGIALKLSLSLAVVVITLIVYRVIRNTIKSRVEDATRLQSMRVVVRDTAAIHACGGA